MSSAGERASERTFTDAADFGERVLNCTAGAVSLTILELVGEGALRGKLIVDVSTR